MFTLPKPLRRMLDRCTVNDLLDHHLAVVRSRAISAKTLAHYAKDASYIRDEFGNDVAKHIKPYQIAAWLRRIHSSGMQAKAQILRYRINDAYKEGILAGLVQVNPVIHVATPRVKIKRQRMTLEQWEAIYRAGKKTLPAWWAHAWMLALVSGQRCSDLVKMRYDDIRDGLLYIEQQKTGARIALPLKLRLDVVGASLHDVIEATRKYQPHGEYLLRSPMGGRNICARTLTHRSIPARKAAGIMADEGRTPPCLHEVRSLAERLYRAQGVDTKTLLGHKRQHMTDVYNDDRGLSDGQWRVLKLQ